MQRWAISRAGIRKRARELGVELIRPDRDTCLWPAAAMELGEQLHQHLQAGLPVRKFPGLPRDGEAKPVRTPDTEPVTTAAGKITRREPVTAPVTAPETLAALAAALRPAPDPLAVPEALARAADGGHWLSNVELADLLGWGTGTVSRWEDGHSPRPGFRLERRQDAPRAPIWWRVHRDP